MTSGFCAIWGEHCTRWILTIGERIKKMKTWRRTSVVSFPSYSNCSRLYCGIRFSPGSKKKVTFYCACNKWKSQRGDLCEQQSGALKQSMTAMENTRWLQKARSLLGLGANTIDYRCKNGRFLSVSCTTTSNTGLLSSSETRVNPGIRSWKSTYQNELDDRKPLVVSISQRSEELRLHNLAGLEFDNFKPRLERDIFKCISWLNGSFFGGRDWGFLGERVKTYSTASMSPPTSPTFFCLQTCSPWLKPFLSRVKERSGHDVWNQQKKTHILENSDSFAYPEQSIDVH